MTEVKDGDRVRVVLEGSVGEVMASHFTVGEGRFSNIIGKEAAHVVSVEVLPSPEPEWAVGDVVKDAHGRLFARHPSRPYVWRRLDAHPLEADAYYDLDLVRPLTPLVMNGEAVK